MAQRIILGLLFLATTRSFATPQLDKDYALRSIVPVVLNLEQDPVYAEHVEAEILKYLKTTPRFEVNEEAYKSFSAEVHEMYLLDNKVTLKDKLGWLKAQIAKIPAGEVDAVIVAEVLNLRDGYRLNMALLSITDADLILESSVNVEDRYSLNSFTAATQLALGEVVKQIPFDGTIVRRDGYRLVIDRGGVDLSIGQEIPVYTVEKRPTGIALEETGYIRITETGDTLSFGTILYEKKPAEITALNKVLLSPPELSREPSSLLGSSATSNKIAPRQLGLVQLNLGTDFINISNLTSSGTGSSSGSTTYPGGLLRGELWITNRTFAELELGFAMATVTGNSGAALNSSANSIRGQVGYRIALAQGQNAPALNLKLGYSRHQIAIDPSTDPLGFNSATFGGITAGGGVSFVITNEYGVGFELCTLVFPSISESPLTSGATTTNVNGWQFTLHGYKHLTEKIDLLARINFESYGAEFTGQGTRPTPIASVTQSARSIMVGAAYYF